MKTSRNWSLSDSALVASILGICGATLGHEVPVHEKITLHAEASALQLSQNYAKFLSAITPASGLLVFQFQGHPWGPSSWMVYGSGQEDNVDTDAGKKRPLNHFYDPLSGLALSDLPFGLSPKPLGQPSPFWAATLNAPGLDISSPFSNVGAVNTWSWQNARSFQWSGLTDPDPTVRQQNLAQFFRAVGQVIHLLQDASQPQHVRNEQHLDKILGLNISPYRSPFEKYGLENVSTLTYTHGMLDWRAAGFNKMRDFWDRDLYVWDRNSPDVRSPQALVDSEDATQPTKKLGLAEFVNGNFLGIRHTYRETYGPSPYPYPSLEEGTDWLNLIRYGAAFAKHSTIGDGTSLRYVVAKKWQGRTVDHHGAVDYLVGRHFLDPPGIPYSVPDLITDVRADDPEVLKDYHDILIPEAIRYSAGLLDYFFRGQLVVTAVQNGTQYQFHIVNHSGQSISGGTFTLYQDDAAGNRTTVSTTLSWGPNSNLGDGGELDGTFAGSFPLGTKFTLVYQGTIGVDGSTPPNAFDSVDAGRAVAASTVTVQSPYQICNWPTLLSQLTVPASWPSSTDPAWNGVFDHQSATSPAGFLAWYFVNGSISGKTVAGNETPDYPAGNWVQNDCFTCLRYDPTFGGGIGGWLLCVSSISCGDPSFAIWSRYSQDPSSPQGTYSLLNSAGMGPNVPGTVDIINAEAEPSCACFDWTPPAYTLTGPGRTASASSTGPSFSVSVENDSTGSLGPHVSGMTGTLPYAGGAQDAYLALTVRDFSGASAGEFYVTQDGNQLAHVLFTQVPSPALQVTDADGVRTFGAGPQSVSIHVTIAASASSVLSITCGPSIYANAQSYNGVLTSKLSYSVHVSCSP